MKKIAAGIITYNPDISLLSQEIKSLVCFGIKTIIVVDNCSNNIIDISNLTSCKEVVLIKNNENYGVARALNQIFRKASELKIEAVLTLDQDSILPSNTLSLLIQDYFENKIGIVCPSINYIGKNHSVDSERIVPVEWAITSGSLTNLKAWESAAGFNELLFIDYVDYDFCFRIRKLGYKVLQKKDVVFSHHLGEIKKGRFLFLKRTIISHSAIRYYYKARNLTFLCKKKEIGYFAYVKKIMDMRINALFESDSKKKRAMLKLGIHDGKRLFYNHYKTK